MFSPFAQRISNNLLGVQGILGTLMLIGDAHSRALAALCVHEPRAPALVARAVDRAVVGTLSHLPVLVVKGNAVSGTLGSMTPS